VRKGTAIFWSIFVAAAIIRIAVSFYRVPPDASLCLRQLVHGIGKVEEDPQRKETGQVFILSVNELYAEKDKLCARDLLLRVKTKLYPRFSYGDMVNFRGKLSRPINFTSNNGHSFDYKGYLAKDDVFYEIKSAVVESASKITEIATSSSIRSLSESRNNVIDVNSWLFLLKRSFVSNLDKVLGEPHSALAAGLVVGDKAALGKDLLNDFRIVGLIHIVVLSGFNITIVAVALRRLLSFLPRVWGIVIGAVGIALFGVMVGGGATVVRSCFMAGIALCADLIRRDYSVGRALAFAGLIMLIQNPLVLLHDPSFQLSFLATLGLILLAEPIQNKLTFIPEKFGIRDVISTSFATQIFVSPYILYMMGQISIIGVIVNILVLPFIPITMLAVFLTGALGFIHLNLAMIAGWSTHLLLSYELFIVEKFARIPYAAAYLPPFSFWWVAGFYGVFLLIYLFLKQHK